jgi:hypothetical protein
MPQASFGRGKAANGNVHGKEGGSDRLFSLSLLVWLQPLLDDAFERLFACTYLTKRRFRT